MTFGCSADPARDTCNNRQEHSAGPYVACLASFLKRAFFIVVAQLAACAAFAAMPGEQRLIASCWTTENGLPQNSVTAISRTRDGYLWMGTFGGLSRFNGSDFRTFTHENTSGIRGHRISDIFEDSRGVLWVATQDGGLSQVVDGKFSPIEGAFGLNATYVTSVAESKDGALWIGSDKGLARVEDGKARIFTVADGLPDDFVPVIRALSDGSVWIGTGSGVARYDKGRISVPWSPTDGRRYGVMALYEDSGGSLWMGTDSLGLVKMSGREGVQIFPASAERDGRPLSGVRGIFETSDGTLWLGGAEGLITYDGSRFSTPSWMEGAASGAGRAIRTIYGDADGDMWVGTDGEGLFRLRRPRLISIGREDGMPGDSVIPIVPDGKGGMLIGAASAGLARYFSGSIFPLKTGDGDVKDAVWSLCPARDGSLWIGTWGGGLIHRTASGNRVFTTSDGLPSNVVLSIHEDRGGAVWVGTHQGAARISGGRVVSFDKSSGLAGNWVTCITEDRSGTLWIGTQEGASRYRNGAFDSLTMENGLSCGHVRWILEDEEGSVWLATYGGGLNRLRDGKLLHASTRNGLIDDSLNMIIGDRKGNLWISSNKGIMKIGKGELKAFFDGGSERLTVAYFTKAEGMGSSECNGGGQPAGCLAPDGRIWFPTIKGVVVIDPEMKDLPPPAVVVEQIAVNRGDPFEVSGEAELGPGAETVEFHYAAICYSDPEMIRYRFMLEGIDDRWVEAGVRRHAYYTKLHPGRYRFRVMACNSDGIWSEKEAFLKIRLVPRFYQTLLFRILCVLFLIVAVTAFFMLRVSSLKRRAERLEKTVSERTRHIEEQKKALAILNDELFKSHWDLQEVFEHLRTGVLIVRSNGGIAFLNRTAQQMLGISPDDSMGRNWREVVPFSPDTRRQIARVMEGGGSAGRPFGASLEQPGGKTLWGELEIVSHPRLPDQKIFYFHGMTEAFRLQEDAVANDSRNTVMGQSPAMLAIYRTIKELGKVDATVLVRGETGSGKEVVARAIHLASRRREKPFVAINCAGLTETILASQLFGHKKGSFTGAVADQVGLIEAAGGGTLLLDEIGDMSLEVQRTLLRVLQEREIVRLGETSARHVDLRFIAATHRDLEQQVIEGTFRQDLLYRIRVAEIKVPPLRERTEDIPLLANSFMAEFRESNQAVRGFSREAMEAMLSYGWPGNVRELKSAVESAMVKCKGPVIMPEDIPLAIYSGASHVSAGLPRETDEMEKLVSALRQTKGNIILAAKKLGVTRMTIYRWISKYKVDVKNFR